MKRPAMPFYVESWLAPGAARDMGPYDRGVYIDLLAYAWDNSGISRDAIDGNCSALAHMAGISPRSFRQVWQRIRHKFVLNECDRYVNPKSEEVRERSEKRARTQSENSKNRYDRRKSGSPSDSDSDSDSGLEKPEEETEKRSSASPPTTPPAQLRLVDPEHDAPPPPAPPRERPTSDQPPLPFTPDQALSFVAEAERFVASRLDRGHAIAVTRLIRAHPKPEEWRLVGQWLAAGGDGWRQTVDVRAIGDFEAWLEHAKAWDAASRPPLNVRAGPARVPPRTLTEPMPAQKETKDLTEELLRV